MRRSGQNKGSTMMKLQKVTLPSATRTRRAAILATSLAILISILCAGDSAAAQSTKGQSSRLSGGTGGYAAPANIGQARQQQQSYTTPQTRSSPAAAAVTAKRRSQQQQQREEPAQQAPTEDPLSDSEPALYGSVAGQPGVDFPGYTRIPKTSFTCEGKGFDFGFYADEEAGCQVYHVCWSGRRESFLCGVGTVFNQAILACDYWHSVDCSKSSQFYGVNSELGKAGAEPASGGSQRIQPARTQATLPGPSSSSSSLGYGDNINQKRTNQQQYNTNTNQNSDDSNFDVPQQQQQQLVELAPTQIQQQQPAYGAKNDNRQQQQQQTSGYQTPTFALQRSQPIEYQQRADTKSNQRAPTTTLATPPAKRPRFNMDFNQKVNSLIESPVRAPIKSSSPIKQRQQTQQQQQRPANLAQLAVSRAQQSGSQSLNPGPARKPTTNGGQIYQQKQTYEVDVTDEPQVIQQQQSFDDSPVQTSTASSGNYANGANRQTTPTNSNGFVPQQQQIIVQSGGGPDGSSAITSQYDTLSPAGGSSNDQSYESSLDDSSSNPNDDFRSSGAKAAASHNQNWYIMRSI